MRAIFKSHRTMGYETARTTDNEGTELVVLQVTPTRREVSPAHMLRVPSPEEVVFDVRVKLAEVIEQARFWGVESEVLEALFSEELLKEA
jgi:hypothetical protein